MESWIKGISRIGAKKTKKKTGWILKNHKSRKGKTNK
jgi:hypothetical protein